jgi:putative PLP-dependent aminotransferase (TIGR04422 family)
MNNAFMWPQIDITSKTVSNDKEVLSDIEQYFSSLYAPYHVVYFSRARNALIAISAVKNLNRSQLTFVQPFSSHCVLSAVSHLSTPTTTDLRQSHQQIVYHQWGHKTQVDKGEYSNILIEDAVDSLILSNDHNELFPNNAPFCLISLPKVCKVSIGAIVICQHEQDFNNLAEQRKLMGEKSNIALNNIDVPIFKEPMLQALPTLVPALTKGIQTLIEDSVQKIRDNLTEINQLFPRLTLTDPTTKQRLPSNVIIRDSEYSAQQLYLKVPFKVLEQQRTFYNYQQHLCEKVWLLPSHCQSQWLSKS